MRWQGPQLRLGGDVERPPTGTRVGKQGSVCPTPSTHRIQSLPAATQCPASPQPPAPAPDPLQAAHPPSASCSSRSPPSPPQLTLRLLPVGKTPTLLPPEDQLPPRMSPKTPDARGLVCTPHPLPDKGTPQSAPKSTKSLYAAVAKRCPSFGWMWFRC